MLTKPGVDSGKRDQRISGLVAAFLIGASPLLIALVPSVHNNADTYTLVSITCTFLGPVLIGLLVGRRSILESLSLGAVFYLSVVGGSAVLARADLIADAGAQSLYTAALLVISPVGVALSSAIVFAVGRLRGRGRSPSRAL
jgi:hypothetical protein